MQSHETYFTLLAIQLFYFMFFFKDKTRFKYKHEYKSPH